ncbi:MAG: kynureninase, partial [Limnohabitans sp.]|nr:kynureninase [Limnohabitans sp.]
MNITLSYCQEKDHKDPLACLQNAFEIPDGLIYLDGNSLGALPKRTAKHLHEVITQEWGNGLIRSWNDAQWFAQPVNLGNRISPWIGAQRDEVIV